MRVALEAWVPAGFQAALILLPSALVGSPLLFLEGLAAALAPFLFRRALYAGQLYFHGFQEVLLELFVPHRLYCGFFSSSIVFSGKFADLYPRQFFSRFLFQPRACLSD